MDSTDETPQTFEPVERLRHRLRVHRSLQGLLEGTCVGLPVLAVMVTAFRTGWAPINWPVAIGLFISFVVAGAAIRFCQTVDRLDAARRIDRSHELHDRFSTAIALSNNDDSTAPPRFVRAQLRDAADHCAHIDVTRAAPWKWPPDTRLAGILTAIVVLLAVIPMPDHSGALPDPVEIAYPPVMDDATLALERDRLDRFRNQLDEDADDDVRDVVEQLETLLDAVESRDISARTFSARLQRLQDNIADDLEVTTGDVTRSLAEAANTLDDSVVDAARDALTDGDFARAAEQLSELSRRLEDDDFISERETERLADALDEFAEQLEAQHDDLHRRHHDDERRQNNQHDPLLENSSSSGPQPDTAPSDPSRTLEQLSRQLSDAADELRSDVDQHQPPSRRDGDSGAETEGDDIDSEQPRHPNQSDTDTPGGAEEEHSKTGQSDRGDRHDGDRPGTRNQAGERLDEAADQLEELQRQRRHQEQRRRAREQLDELHEAMSRSGAGGDSGGKRMEDYLERARGDENDERSRRGDDESVPDEQPGAADHQQGRREDAEQGGRSADDSSRPDTEDLDFDHVNRRLEGVDSHSGPTRSQIIESAAEEGFATRDYDEVYSEYEEVVEEIIERDNIPDGYRYQIERYFDLIRPDR